MEQEEEFLFQLRQEKEGEAKKVIDDEILVLEEESKRSQVGDLHGMQRPLPELLNMHRLSPTKCMEAAWLPCVRACMHCCTGIDEGIFLPGSRLLGQGSYTGLRANF